MRALTSLVVLSFALLGCEGPLLFVEVEEPDLCMTEEDVSFPGAAGLPAGSTDITEEFAQDLADVPLADLRENETQVRLNAVTLTAPAGVLLDFFGTVTVVLLAPASNPEGLPAEVTLAQFDRTSAPPSNTLTLGGGPEAVDLGPYMRSGQVRLRVAFTDLRLGDLPPADWTADVKTCVYLKNKTGYGQFVGL